MTSTSFVGFAPNNDAGNSFISDCQKLIKGTGVVLRKYGRNRNRKQFYASFPKGAKHRYAQNLPLKYATHFGLYVYRDHKKNIDYKTSVAAQDKAKIVVDTVRRIYQLNGVKLNITGK